MTTCAGRRPREDINDPKFRHWLVERNYANESEMESLDEWANKLPMDKFDIRPSIQVTRSWQLADAVGRDRKGQLIAEVHEAINQVLAALDEPRLEDIQP
jgi:ATP/maltotriose-dependent transcriptional regulator MalT